MREEEWPTCEGYPLLFGGGRVHIVHTEGLDGVNSHFRHTIEPFVKHSEIDGRGIQVLHRDFLVRERGRRREGDRKRGRGEGMRKRWRGRDCLH